MMNTRCTKLSMVRDDAKSSKTSNKKCPVVLHGDLIQNISPVALLKVPEEGYIAVRGQLYRMEEGGLTWFLHSCVYYNNMYMHTEPF